MQALFEKMSLDYALLLFPWHRYIERALGGVAVRDIIFQGAATALITPFGYDSYIDYKTMEKLIEFQLREGINALVVAGTTGESATLTDEEHYELVKFVVDTVAGRVPVIAGAGSNSTDHARRLCRASRRAGADGVLMVTPYYNKTNISGLVNHYRICSETMDEELPIIIYNVPSRTGYNIKPEYYEKLLDIKNIVAVKEASGNISQIAKIIADFGSEISVYAGNDDMIIPVLSLGGKGVISVVSNLVPGEVEQICIDFFEGKIERSKNMFLHYLELISSMFFDVNPIPVKEAMGIYGFGSGNVRPPLAALSDDKKKMLQKVLEKYHIF